MNLGALFSARDYLKVKQHAPGQLKLGVSPAILGDPVFKELSAAKPDALPKGVHAVDVSVFTMSVSVRYDADVIPPDMLDELLTTSDADRGRELLGELNERLGLDLA